MKRNEILNYVNHRPWAIPKNSWQFYQEWNNAIFLHWKVDENELKKFVPEGLEIDLIKGSAWVSVVAFDMDNITMKQFPSFPPISNFHEINIRTYVKCNNKTGVYFLSIEGSKSLSCFIAKKMSHLPYRYSKMKRSISSFESLNKSYNDNFLIEFKVGNSLNKKSDLDKFLTERYALFQDYKAKMYEFEIHHIEWPIQTIEIDKLELNYSRFESLIKGNPDLQHYSKGVQVVAWDKTVV